MDLMVSQIPRKNGATAAQTVLISSHAALKAAQMEFQTALIPGRTLVWKKLTTAEAAAVMVCHAA